jgi:hypothetical protein
LGATLLYWIIRLGVKHGMRSYYAYRNRETTVDMPSGVA